MHDAHTCFQQESESEDESDDSDERLELLLSLEQLSTH